MAARRRPPSARVPKPLVVAACLLPALYLAYAASQGFDYNPVLGANPIKELEHRTGDWTLRFLVLTLAITPLRQLTGWNDLIKYRRTIGLVTFAYGVSHLLVWVVLDNFFDAGDMLADIIKRPYITIGMASLLLMTPLAITSTAKMVKRLGGRRWRRLHQLVYVIAVGGTLHFWMSLKKDKSEALIYVAVFAVLLGWRAVRALRRGAHSAPA